MSHSAINDCVTVTHAQFSLAGMSPLKWDRKGANNLNSGLSYKIYIAAGAGSCMHEQDDTQTCTKNEQKIAGNMFYYFQSETLRK